ncbi:DUF3369 domain-containing protein [Aestuariibacter salexigens]|uniref:DUF3369 domain-containing protein n=1 Tax=Aestuariibacter salexigens TaxID=226010 RepID=UPI00041DF182|nr:DUF3369 domain-containing protein [Aestuariibacter salexigens]
MNDDFLFADDTDEEVSEELGSWKVLIVDDEPEVHAVTKLALSDFVFLDKRLEFISAYSGKEARKIFDEHHDIAVVLLDVVMETDDAGLQVANYIRNQANNHFTRIILRTGQPGQAPEKDVILNYDINDYKSKTELTAQKLFTVIIATLRSYRDIVVIEENRRGLEKIISASANLFSQQSLESFVEGIVQQLASLLGGTKDAAYITSAVAGPKPIEKANPVPLFVFAGNGEFQDSEGRKLDEIVDSEQLATCEKALSDKSVVYHEEHLAAYCNSTSNRGSLLFLSGLPRKLTEVDRRLVEIFAQNVQIALDNVLLTRDIKETQREIVERLGQAMEKEMFASQHIKRMVQMCEVIARGCGMSEPDIEILKLAVPLHDIGKSKVPTAILTKQGKLDDDEVDVVRQHTEFGYALLKNSDRPIIKAAAIMARDHHEHWDGSGYPNGLKGDDISVFSRITALIDVYDALRSARCYKAPWEKAEALNEIVSASGTRFDPKLVKVLEQKVDELEAIIEKYPDVSSDSDQTSH